ncbi:MAG: DUF1573 domain-containing protein [Candidatus Zixiibacteriota bacterium]
MTMVRLLSASAVLLLVINCGAFAQPNLQIPGERFEMGSIPQQSVVSHCFWFTSTGTDTLIINEIKTPCGCQVEPLEKNWIAPGDSMLVSICWDVKKRVGPTGNYPYIYTNVGPETFRVYLTGTVTREPDAIRPVSVKPFALDLSKFRERAVDSLSFRIINHSDTSYTLTPVSFFVDECDIILPDSVAARSTAIGTIKVRPEFLDKEFYRSITLLLNDTRKTRITIPIKRKIY